MKYIYVKTIKFYRFKDLFKDVSVFVKTPMPDHAVPSGSKMVRTEKKMCDQQILFLR